MSVLKKYPLPGDVFETTLGHFFEVVGTEHTDQYIMARSIIPDRILITDKEKYDKYLERKTTENFDSTQSKKPNKSIQNSLLIHADLIKKMYYADEFLANIQETESLINKNIYKDQIKNALEFCKFLANGAEIDMNRIGITGPMLLYNQMDSISSIDNTDINLIIYGLSESTNVREFLRKCNEKRAEISSEFQNCSIRPFNHDELKSIHKQWEYKGSVSIYDFIKFEYRKLRQGVFNDHHYFIKYLEFSNREDYKNQTLQSLQNKTHDIGHAKISGDVRDNQYWWTTPARVGVGNISVDLDELNIYAHESLRRCKVSLTQIKETYTLDDHFIENIRLLEQFAAYGTVRLIVPIHESPYLQLVIGKGIKDFLKFK